MSKTPFAAALIDEVCVKSLHENEIKVRKNFKEGFQFNELKMISKSFIVKRMETRLLKTS
jgi:hypothetical protein